MEALMAGERQALKMMAAGAPLPAILEVVVRNIEAQAGAMQCSILLLDEAGTHLLHGAAPSLPDAYNHAIHGMTIGPDAGSCGTAACRNETVIVADIATDPLWRDFKDLALAHELRACWPKPICGADGRVLGTFAVYDRQPRRPSPIEVELVERAASQARIAIERKRAEAELEKTHKQLLDASRQAGMAEVATGVLHNVGNVPNSVNVSSTLVADGVRKSRLPNLFKAVALLREHDADMGAFLTTDPKGRQLPVYFSQLAAHLAGEQAAALKELEHLQKNIEHIKDIVAMQQTYAKTSGMSEIVQITDLVEDSLNINATALARHGITVVREFAELPPVVVEKHKVLQILVNLIGNAKHACDKPGSTDKRITLRVAGEAGVVKISVSDNGVGIPAQNLVRIFSHGFTTKKEGHGFGLHSGANAAKEMGGSLTVQSRGAGHGATFTLELPLAQCSTR